MGEVLYREGGKRGVSGRSPAVLRRETFASFGPIIKRARAGEGSRVALWKGAPSKLDLRGGEWRI